MTSRVLLRSTLVVPVLFATMVACSDNKDGNGPGAGSFTLGAPATSQVTVPAGSSVNVTIPVTFTGAMSPVTLTADSVPAGISVGFQPTTITAGTEQVTFAIRADPTIAAKTATIKIIAKATDMTDQVARVTVTTTPAPTYTLANNTTSAAPVVIKRGQGNTVTLTLDRTGGFTGPLDIIPDAIPAGFTVTPLTGVTGNTATLTINTANLLTPSGTGSFTVRATNPTIGDRTTTIRYNVTPEYTLTNSSSAANPVVIQRTQSGTATITVNRDTYQGALALAASSLPKGISVASVNVPAGSNTATITIATADSAVADTGSFVITGTAAGLQNQTTRVRYKVLAEPGVQIAVANRTVLQSSPDTVYVTVNREGGFTGPVTVTLSGLPAGISADPVTQDTGSTVGVPLDIGDNAAVGAATITASVSGAGIATKTKTGTLTVVSNMLTSGTGITIASTRARDTYTIYRVNVPAGATQLTVTLLGGTGDADVEVYNSNFSARLGASGKAGNNETITVNNPPAGTAYIVVYVWDPYAGATLTATVTGGSASTQLRTLQARTSLPKNLRNPRSR